MPELTFERLRAAVAGDAVALRSRMTLHPAGGEGDKVFPPTYSVEGRAEHQYAVEERQVGDGEKLAHDRIVGLRSFAGQPGGTGPARWLGTGRTGVPGTVCRFCRCRRDPGV